MNPTSRRLLTFVLLATLATAAVAGEPADGSILARIRIPFGSGGTFPPAEPGSIVALDDGRFLISADVGGAGPSLARVDSAGALDPTFGDAGVVRDVTGGLLLGLKIDAVAVAPDGKILLGGTDTAGPTGPRGAIVRLEADGTLDETFAGDGVQIVDLPPASLETRLTGVAVDAAGRTLASGATEEPWTLEQDLFVVRLDAAGEPDPTFSGDGVALLSRGGAERSRGLVGLPSGEILVGASVDPSDLGLDLAVLKLLADGSADTTFGDDGWAVAPSSLVPFGSELSLGIALDARGRPVVYGFACAGDLVDPCFTSTWVAARFLPGGGIDASFSSNGVAHGPVASFEGLEYASAGALQPGDRLALGGAWWGTGPEDLWADFGFARLAADGELDAGFGGGYVVVDPAPPESDSSGGISGVVCAPDGRLAAVGGVAGGGVHFLRLANAAIFVDGFDRGSVAAWSDAGL